MTLRGNISSSSSGGIGFFGLLTIALITLKLLGYINWPWFWVLSPFWGGCLLGIIVLAVMIVIALAVSR